MDDQIRTSCGFFMIFCVILLYKMIAVKKALLVLAVLVLLAGMSACTSGKKTEKPPNIIFIMSDDHAYQAVSAYGYGLNSTPNIDRLAKEGALFRRACVTNSLCAPSRAVMLTGLHSYLNGKIDNVERFDWTQQTFTKVLQQNGYQTALVGKIHLDGVPQGFDYSMVLEGQGEYYNPDFLIDGKKQRINGYVTEIITDTAINWLKNGRDKDKPFCLLYHQKAPHRNFQPSPKYINALDNKHFDVPETFFDDYSNRGRAAKEQEMSIARDMLWGHDFKLMTDPDGKPTGYEKQIARYTPEQRKIWDEAYVEENKKFLEANLKGKELADWKFNRYIRDYLNCIQSVDDGVGELLDYLDKEGLAENTIVVYTSDQGFYLGEHGWFDKRFAYEESFRTPLLIRYPKEIKAGTTIDKLVQNLDFAPTFLDYAGIKAPQQMQGISFRHLVDGSVSQWRDAVYYTYYEYPAVHMVKRHYAVVTDRYKLIHFYFDIDEWELYDLKTDPREMKNVYNDPGYTEVRAMMHKRLEEIRKEYRDSDSLNTMYLNKLPDSIRNK